MSPSVSQRLADVHPKSLGIKTLKGESRPNFLGLEEFRERFGRALGHALQLSGLTPQELAFRLWPSSESGAATISKWLNGKEPVPMALVACKAGDDFNAQFAVAYAAEFGGQATDVRTTITVRRLA